MYLIRAICRSGSWSLLPRARQTYRQLYHPRKVSLPQQLLMYISSGRTGPCALWVLTVDSKVSLSWMALLPEPSLLPQGMPVSLILWGFHEGNHSYTDFKMVADSSCLEDRSPQQDDIEPAVIASGQTFVKSMLWSSL